MGSRADIYHNVKAVKAVEAAAETGSAEGTVVDLAGYRGVVFVIDVGTATIGFDAANKLDFTLYEGSKADMSDKSEVAAADLLGTIPSLAAAAADNSVYQFGYRGNKRYLRLDTVETGAQAATLSCVAILGDPLDAPAV